jgi:type I restriction enzyme, S subunit
MIGLEAHVQVASLPDLPLDWQWVRFADLCERVSVGHVGPTTKHFVETGTGVRLIRSQNVRPGKLVLDDIIEISTDFHAKLRKSQLRSGDVLVVRVGANRSDCCVVPEGVGPINCANIVFARPQESGKFFSYYFNTTFGRKMLLGATTGAAQEVINTKSVADTPVPLPPLNVRTRIEDTLSAYDDLIENNRRRIALLEQAARLLYREWFVHCRFPGSETAKFVDGLPEGWEIKRVSDFGDVITGKTPSKKNAANFGGSIPFIKTPDMHGKVFVRNTDEFLSNEGAKTQPKKTLPERSILVSCIGTVGVVSMNAAEAQTNQQINAVVPNDEHSSLYGFFALQDLRPRLEAIGGGVTMANVSKGKFESVPFLIPSSDIQQSFDELAEPMFCQILKLADANQKLAKARDLLLPRLMDGRLPIPE